MRRAARAWRPRTAALAAAVTGVAAWLACTAASAADSPQPAEGDYVIRDFRFGSGDTLPQLRIHYRTYGAARRDAQGVVRNAILILHGTGGSGANFLRPSFAGELYGAGQPLDVTRYYIIIPDDIGHGASSKPSDGLKGRFPHYRYRDMVRAEYLLLTEGLKVNHAHLVMGTSMGGMHTWMWGEEHPEFMDALMPLASLPTQISGRNRVWRRLIVDAIRNDPAYQGGDYQSEPPSLRTAEQMLWLMSSNPALRFQEAPTRAQADAVIDDYVAKYAKLDDANDILYAVDASSDYDPGPALEQIQAPLLAINTADDLINPPEQGILEREIKRVPHGRAMVIPMSDQTHGHGSHTYAVLWKQYLVELLASPER